MMAPPGMFPHM
jgi:hypothetical protein